MSFGMPVLAARRVGGGGGDPAGTVGPIALAYRSSTAAVSPDNPIPFDNEVYDNEDVITPTSANFAIPSDGIYRMSMVASHSTNVGVKQGLDSSAVEGGYGEANDLTTPYWKSGISAPIPMTSGENAQMLAAYGSINLGQNGGFYSACCLERLPSDLKYARLARATTLTGHTSGVIAWDSEVTDTDGFYDSGSPTRLTIPSGVSRVRVTANLESANYSGYIDVRIYKNGALASGCVRKISGRGGLKMVNLASAPLEVTAGDYFELYVEHAAAQSIAPAPQTWLAIEEVPSSHVYALVEASGSQSITSSSNIMLFDTEVSDSENMHSTSTNTGRLTVPAGVTYARAYFNGVTSASTANAAWVDVLLNGSTFAGIAADKCDNNNGSTKGMSGVSAWVAVSEGDYFEVRADTQGITTSMNTCWFALECR